MFELAGYKGGKNNVGHIKYIITLDTEAHHRSKVDRVVPNGNNFDL